MLFWSSKRVYVWDKFSHTGRWTGLSGWRHTHQEQKLVRVKAATPVSEEADQLLLENFTMVLLYYNGNNQIYNIRNEIRQPWNVTKIYLQVSEWCKILSFEGNKQYKILFFLHSSRQASHDCVVNHQGHKKIVLEMEKLDLIQGNSHHLFIHELLCSTGNKRQNCHLNYSFCCVVAKLNLNLPLMWKPVKLNL